MNCANHPDRERVSFCQNCGKPLCAECMRSVGAAVFCEPCLEARLAAADASSKSQGAPYSNVNVPPVYGAALPSSPGASNPYIAGALGFIPGVGAMYNGQYAKGVVHLVIFAVLVSLADANGVFGLLVAGWVIYQGIEAYHTAQARRDGTPLPNPFGLNDIGEKFGFGKSWPAGPAATLVAPPAAYYAPPAPPYAPPAAPYAPPAAPYAPPAASWSTPPSSYGYTVPPVPPIPTQPYTEQFVPSATDSSFVSAQNRFPTGAIILIALGVLFFFGSSGIFHHFPVERIIPFLLIALGVWIFVRKMTNTGVGLTDDGSPNYKLRLFRALRGSIWVTLVGVLFFLDSFDILSWGHSWPLFIIVAGLMTFFERSAQSAAAATTPYAYSAPSPYPPVTPAPTAPGTEITPAISNDEGGR